MKMSDLDFEQVRGFEPSVDLSTLPVDSPVNNRASNPFPKVASRTEQLHELSLQLHRPEADPRANEVRWQPTENNQRQYSRCSLSAEGTMAILGVNGRRHHCRVVELSIGGFGVVVQGRVELNSGTVCSLRAPGFNYIVSVTRLQTRSDGLFVGLKQLEEVLDHEQHLPGDPSPTLGYAIAGIAGTLIAVACYFFMNAK